MKVFTSSCIVVLFALYFIAAIGSAQVPQQVLKTQPNDQLVGSLHVKSGQTLAIDTGAFITNNGTAAGFSAGSDPVFNSVTTDTLLVNGTTVLDGGAITTDGGGGITASNFFGSGGGLTGVSVVIASGGIFDWPGTSNGGNSTGDNGKLLIFDSNGAVTAQQFFVGSSVGPNPGLTFNGGFTGTLRIASGTTAVRTWTLPDASGTIQLAITFGSGVQPALGVNIGSAGAPVLFNGAGGTPSSITLTNASGIAASLTAGLASALATGRTISITGDLAYTSPSFTGSGNVTAAGTLATVNGNVGSFTNANITVNAKGLVTAASNGTVFDPTQPGPIGGTTPNTGKFTGIIAPSVSTSGVFTISGQDGSGFTAPSSTVIGAAGTLFRIDTSTNAPCILQFSIQGSTSWNVYTNFGDGGLTFQKSGVGNVLRLNTDQSATFFGAINIPAISVTSGTNAKAGTFTLASGVATVSNTSITIHSVIHASPKAGSVSGTIAPICFPTVTAGTGFTVLGGTLDNSVYSYWIEENN